MNGLFSKGVVTAGVIVALAAALPAAAWASPSGSPSCASPALSQPFLPWGDTNEYTPLSGQTFDNVDGTGWMLSGGARLVTTTLQDGSIGQVVDMPAGSVVVTTSLCVNASNYPSARAMVADVAGTQGVTVDVSYESGAGWSRPVAAGNIKNAGSGWDPSKPIMLHAGDLTGLQQLQMTLVAGAGEYQIYNLFVDPRRGH